MEEAFKLLDVDNKGYLTVETFKQVFKNLNLGEISPSDEDIFKEVADFDKDGVINLEDFRKMLGQEPKKTDRWACINCGLIYESDFNNTEFKLEWLEAVKAYYKT